MDKISPHYTTLRGKLGPGPSDSLRWLDGYCGPRDNSSWPCPLASPVPLAHRLRRGRGTCWVLHFGGDTFGIPRACTHTLGQQCIWAASGSTSLHECEHLHARGVSVCARVRGDKGENKTSCGQSSLAPSCLRPPAPPWQVPTPGWRRLRRLGLAPNSILYIGHPGFGWGGRARSIN